MTVVEPFWCEAVGGRELAASGGALSSSPPLRMVGGAGVGLAELVACSGADSPSDSFGAWSRVFGAFARVSLGSLELVACLGSGSSDMVACSRANALDAGRSSVRGSSSGSSLDSRSTTPPELTVATASTLNPTRRRRREDACSACVDAGERSVVAVEISRVGSVGSVVTAPRIGADSVGAVELGTANSVQGVESDSAGVVEGFGTACSGPRVGADAVGVVEFGTVGSDPGVGADAVGVVEFCTAGSGPGVDADAVGVVEFGAVGSGP